MFLFTQVSRTNELVKQIITDPMLWDLVTDDFAPAAESYEPPHLLYVLVHDGTELLGLWAFQGHTQILFEVHTCLLPNARGKRAIQAAREMQQWLWTNTPCQRLITNVPSFNRPALWFARRAGMKQFGLNERSYMKHGKLHDLILLGISRPSEAVCQ